MIYKKYDEMHLQVEYPKRDPKPDRKDFKSNTDWGKALDEWEKAERQYKSRIQEYHNQNNEIMLQFKAELLKSLGLENHPKSELLWDMAWERGHSSGYGEVELVADELANLLS